MPEPCYVLVGRLEVFALVARMGRQMSQVEEQRLMTRVAFDQLHSLLGEQVSAVTSFRVPIHGHIATHVVAFPRLQLQNDN